MALLSLMSVTAVVAVLIVLGFVLLGSGRRPAGCPPGPPTVPILGNLHLIPAIRPYMQFQKWAEEYGPVYSLVLGTKIYIVLSSDTAVKDLLDKKSNIYSSRPDMFMGQEIASGGLRFVVMKYGPTWRMIHKTIHNILNIKAAVTYVPYQDLENKFLLLGLLDGPEEYANHVRRYTNSLSTQMVFGFRTTNIHDPKLQQLFWGFERWGELAGSASAQLADLFPVLQKLPRALAPNVRYAEGLHKKEKELYVGHWMKTKQSLENGTGLPCFCNDLLRAQKVEKFSDDLAGYISGSLLEAGSDTTASILIGFIQAMIVFPEAQEKAKEEIDRVVGTDRIPTVDDYPNMPYIRCCVKESLRWMPNVILGVPHACIKEDEYRGYRIPKDATVINNVWAIHMNPQRHPNPRKFDPSRYEGDHTTLFESATGDASKRDNYNFGAGRRLCQGIHIAERSLFLGISRMLWAFDFSKPIDDQGNPITPDIEDLVGAITVQPAPFGVVIKPRSEKKAEMIRNTWRECEDLLDPETHQWKSVPKGMAFSTWVPEKEDV